MLRLISATLRTKPRFWLPIAFLLVALLCGLIPAVVRVDAGTALGWVGVAAGFLAAGLVDLVSLVEAMRRTAELERSLAPVRATISRYLRMQVRDLQQTVETLLPVAGEPGTWPSQLRGNNAVIIPGEPAAVYPPQTKAIFVSGILREIRGRQEHLEALAAGGILTDKVAAVSDVVFHNPWMAVLGVLQNLPSPQMSGTADMAAEVIVATLELDLG